MSDTFVQELIEVHCAGDYYKPKITAKRDYDGSVTFSVPTVQGVLPALSHSDEPGERGEQGGVDDILVLTDKVDVLSVDFCRHNSKEIELKWNDKFESLAEYWQSLPVPRKMMMPIEDKFPQLHRARLNKPKSI